MISPLRVALVGYGFLGKWHAEKIQKHSQINSKIVFTHIIESNEAIHEQIKQIYPHVKIEKNLESCVKEFDAAILVTPSRFHFENMKYLLENKKHIFCEKPLTTNSNDAKKILDLVQSDRILQVGHSERCHLIWGEIKNYLKDSTFSENPFFVYFKRSAPFKGRAVDVSVVEDVMVHDLDLMDYLFNPGEVIYSAIGIKSRTDKWDTVKANLKDLKGNQYFFEASRDAFSEERWVEIISGHCRLFINLFESSYSILKNGELVVDKVSYPKRDHLYIEQEYFYNSILSKSNIFVSVQDGILAVKRVDDIMKNLLIENKMTKFP